MCLEIIHLKAIPHKVRVAEVLRPRHRNEDSEAFFPEELAARSWCRAYVGMTHLGDKNNATSARNASVSENVANILL